MYMLMRYAEEGRKKQSHKIESKVIMNVTKAVSDSLSCLVLHGDAYCITYEHTCTCIYMYMSMTYMYMYMYMYTSTVVYMYLYTCAGMLTWMGSTTDSWCLVYS